MTGCFEDGRAATHFVRLGLAAALALTAMAASPAGAQYATSCPAPQKLAAGACVTACPAGYEDRGRTCAYRSMSN